MQPNKLFYLLFAIGWLFIILHALLKVMRIFDSEALIWTGIFLETLAIVLFIQSKLKRKA